MGEFDPPSRSWQTGRPLGLRKSAMVGYTSSYAPRANPRPSSNSAPPPRPRAAAAAPRGAAMRPRAVEEARTAEEEEAIDALFRAAHFAD